MESDERECPFCAEVIKIKAKICKHCKKDLPQQQSSIPDSETPTTSRKKKEIKRYCKNCGHEHTGQTAAEFSHSRKCQNCGALSKMLTEAAYSGYQKSKQDKEEFDAFQKRQAAEIHDSLDMLPVLPQDSEPYYYLQAIEKGLKIPDSGSNEETADLVKEANAKNVKNNPYVDLEKCALAIECRRPVSSRQVEYLRRLHVNCAAPLTVNSARRVITRLVGDDYTEKRPLFSCPYCNKKITADSEDCPRCDSSLNDWVLDATFNRDGSVSVKSKTGNTHNVEPIKTPAPASEIFQFSNDQLVDTVYRGDEDDDIRDIDSDDWQDEKDYDGSDQNTVKKSRRGKTGGKSNSTTGCIGCLVIIVIVLYLFSRFFGGGKPDPDPQNPTTEQIQQTDDKL